MNVEIALSVAVIITLGGMIAAERLSLPDPYWRKPAGWRGMVHRADWLLGVTIILCLALIWFPQRN